MYLRNCPRRQLDALVYYERQRGTVSMHGVSPLAHSSITNRISWRHGILPSPHYMSIWSR